MAMPSLIAKGNSVDIPLAQEPLILSELPKGPFKEGSAFLDEKDSDCFLEYMHMFFFYSRMILSSLTA
jgi:hypothetical protein